MIKVKNRAIGPEGLELEVHFSTEKGDDMAFIKVGSPEAFVSLSGKEQDELIRKKVKEMRDSRSLIHVDKALKRLVDRDLEDESGTGDMSKNDGVL